MENENIVLIGDKQFSREQVIVIGKEHYPKFYWIARGVGIALILVGALVCGLLGIVLIILNAVGVFDDPDFPSWVFAIPFGLFGTIVVAGIICFVCSFIGKTEQAYYEHGVKYLTKLDLNNKNRSSKVEYTLSKRDSETLERYNRLLKGGAITQEEYDKKKEELLNK